MKKISDSLAIVFCRQMANVILSAMILSLFCTCFLFSCQDDQSENNVNPNNSPDLSDDDDDDNDDNDNDDNDDNDNNDFPEFLDLTLLSNGLIEVEFHRETGNVLRIDDLTKNPPLSLLKGDEKDFKHFKPYDVIKYDPLFGIDSKEESLCLPQYPPAIVRCDSDPDDCRKLTWKCSGDSYFEATAQLVAGRPAVQFSARVHLTSDVDVLSISYPQLGALSYLSPVPEDNTLAIPYEGGLLIHDPLELVHKESWADFQVLQNLQYPYGHSMMIQMISYQAKNKGGFLIYAKDPNYTTKLFHLIDQTPVSFSPTVLLSIEHGNWDVKDTEGNGKMILDYPVEIAAIDGDTWQHAALLYRQWGQDQIWASDPVADRAVEDRELYEQAAVSVFGISARTNQTEWYRQFHDLLCDGIDNARILFVPGWDFHPNGEMTGLESHAFYQAGWDEAYWLPYQGAFVDNYNVMKGEHSDFVYPFFYDLLVHDGFPGWEGWDGTPASSGDLGAPWENHEVLSHYGIPGGLWKYFVGFPGFTHTLCPANQMVKDFYVWRNRLLVQTSQGGHDLVMDGTYHDVPATIIGYACYDENHDHEKSGTGRWIYEKMRDIHSELIGDGPIRSFSIGMENATELFWDQTDFYHLGDSGIGPFRTKDMQSPPDNPEFGGVNEWIMDSKAWDIPLVSFVYHPYGAIRTGGKIQISNEIGEFFYWAAASEYLWGGIIELIYFNTPVDLLPGINPSNVDCPGGYPCAFQTGWATGTFGNQDWHYSNLHEADPDKIEFLRKAVYLRINAAPEYLVYGEMLVPPTLYPDPPLYDYDYNFYSHIMGQNAHHYGIYPAPSILVQAWQKWTSDEIAFILSNPTNAQQTVDLFFDPADYNLQSTSLVLVDVELPIGPDQILGNCAAGVDCQVPISLEARSFALIELR